MTTEITPNMRAPLAPLAGTPAPRPAWFDAALANAPERQMVKVHGTDIETLSWGERGRPGILLLHGNRAHADWWSYIAPYLSADYRVVAFSWSGMGGSGWRDSYSFDILLDEVDAVCEATGLFSAERKPVVLAHSFGAFVAVRYAASRGERLGGVVTLDLPMHKREMGRQSERRDFESPRENAVYPDVTAALARYRFVPPQPCENLFIADHLARTSLKPAPMQGQSQPGVTWRFDPYFWRDLRMGSPAQDMMASRCPVAFMWGENSVLIDKEMMARVRSKYPPGVPWIEIPAAGHHLMVDQPLGLVAAFRGLLASWPRQPKPVAPKP